MKPILAAIQALLTHKKSTTYAEIASVSGKKKIDVLKTLNENAALIIQKDGKITGLVDKGAEAHNRAFANGITFRICKQDYFGNMIDTRNKVALETLCDGEAYTPADRSEKYITNSNDNLGKIKALGVIDYREYKVPAFTTYWSE
jgi:hypothetical protein